MIQTDRSQISPVLLFCAGIVYQSAMVIVTVLPRQRKIARSFLAEQMHERSPYLEGIIIIIIQIFLIYKAIFFSP